MKYLTFIDDEPILFSDWKSAQKGAEEMGLNLFFPRNDTFSTEEQKSFIFLENGKWVTKSFSEFQEV